MKTKAYDLEGYTYFEFIHVDEKYNKVLESLFYTKDGNRYFKKYPSTIHNIEQFKANFDRFGLEMIEQFGYMKPTPFDESLLAFIERIEDYNLNWALIGGGSLRVRGIPVETHDLDIMLDMKDIDLINQILEDYIVEPICDTEGWVVKYFGVAFLHARIDLSFGPEESADQPHPSDFGPYAMEHLEEINWNGHQIKVPPIDLYLNVSKRRGRQERVKLIEDYLIINNI